MKQNREAHRTASNHAVANRTILDRSAPAPVMPGKAVATWPLDDEPFWRRSPDVAWVDSGARIVVLDLRESSSQAGKPLALDESASVVWRQIDGTQSTAQIAESVAQEFGQQPFSLRMDINQFLTQLADHGFIVRVVPSS